MSVLGPRPHVGFGARWWWAALAVLALGLALRVLPPVDWEGGDAENYSCIAWRLAGGEGAIGSDSGPPHEPGESIGPRAFAIRPAVTVPASWLLRAWAPAPWVFALYPLALGLSEIVLAIAFGRRLWGPKAGLLAGLLVACLPLAVSEARALRADLPAATFLGWGMFCLWTGTTASRTGSRVGLGLLSGILFGMSWLAKETIVLAAPAIACVGILLARREGVRGWIALGCCVGAGLLVLGAEAAAYAARTGDPLHRFHELARNFEQCRENFFYADSPAHGWPEGGYAKAVLTRIAIAGPKQILFARPMLGLGFLGMLAGFILWRRNDASAVPVLAWLVLLALAFNFGSTSLTEYRPVVPASTYFQPIVLPACLLCGALVAARIGSRWVRGGVAAFLVAAGVLSIAVNVEDRQATARLRHWAGTLPDEARVAIDFRGTVTWSYLREGTPAVGPETVAFEAIRGPDEVDFVVVRGDALEFLRGNYRYEPPAWLGGLGEDGRTEEIARVGNDRLYRVRRDGHDVPGP